ncbi:MAG: hypothetical protein ACYTAS_14855 [Planctomycetota bacterium]
MQTKKFLISVIVVSIIWFILPVGVYAIFVRFCGLIPPSEFTAEDLIISIPIAFLHGFAFVLLFFLCRGSTIARNGLLYGFLWWLGYGVVSEVGFWNALKFPTIMMVAGVTANLTLLVNGIVVEKISK